MSYESEQLQQMAMPTREQVATALLRTLFRHGGVIKEFCDGETIVEEIADGFGLSRPQREARLKTIYQKENRVKTVSLWHRLLFRSADMLAHERLVSRPTQTLKLTKIREWMLTERGFDEALRLCSVPIAKKDSLPIKSYEVQKIANKIMQTPKPQNYDPIAQDKRHTETKRKSALRNRGFRQAVIESYCFTCAVCGLKISSPDLLFWEVEAAHIVPNYLLGRDDIWNGIALCRLHHWAFDVGWFTVLDDYRIKISEELNHLPADFGKIGGYNFIRAFASERRVILLPKQESTYPDRNAIRWHRQNVFQQRSARAALPSAK
ncbi:MAG: HNH endonuclease [Phycisphaerae bacterium]